MYTIFESPEWPSAVYGNWYGKDKTENPRTFGIIELKHEIKNQLLPIIVLLRQRAGKIN